MNVFLVFSSYTDDVVKVSEELLKYGYQVTSTNDKSNLDLTEVTKSDIVLVLNYDKKDKSNNYPNCINGRMFIDIYNAYKLGKKIFLYNDIPSGSLHEEIEEMNPVIIDGSLTKFKFYTSNNFSRYMSYDEYARVKKKSDLYLKAFNLVNILFEGRVDKGGRPYVEHLYRVADRVDEIDTKTAALLHDTLEDIDYITKEDLMEIGFTKDIVEIVELVTKQYGKGKVLSSVEKLALYDKKIDEIIASGNMKAINLKIADMSDNFDPSRIEKLSLDKQEWFNRKYSHNLEKLKQVKEKEKVYVRY